MEIGTFKERLRLIFLDFKALEEAEKQVALDLAVGLLRQMLREDNGTKQRLAEIERRARSGADKGGKSGGGKKARAALVRRTYAQSPQAPLKPVPTTKNNELRR